MADQYDENARNTGSAIADDDPLAELARIIGYERPAEAPPPPAEARDAVAAEPAPSDEIDLEAELMGEFEPAYQQPGPAYQDYDVVAEERPVEDAPAFDDQMPSDEEELALEDPGAEAFWSEAELALDPAEIAPSDDEFEIAEPDAPAASQESVPEWHAMPSDAPAIDEPETAAEPVEFTAGPESDEPASMPEDMPVDADVAASEIRDEPDDQAPLVADAYYPQRSVDEESDAFDAAPLQDAAPDEAIMAEDDWLSPQSEAEPDQAGNAYVDDAAPEAALSDSALFEVLENELSLGEDDFPGTSGEAIEPPSLPDGWDASADDAGFAAEAAPAAEDEAFAAEDEGLEPGRTTEEFEVSPESEGEAGFGAAAAEVPLPDEVPAFDSAALDAPEMLHDDARALAAEEEAEFDAEEEFFEAGYDAYADGPTFEDEPADVIGTEGDVAPGRDDVTEEDPGIFDNEAEAAAVAFETEDPGEVAARGDVPMRDPQPDFEPDADADVRESRAEVPALDDVLAEMSRFEIPDHAPAGPTVSIADHSDSQAAVAAAGAAFTGATLAGAGAMLAGESQPEARDAVDQQPAYADFADELSGDLDEFRAELDGDAPATAPAEEAGEQLPAHDNPEPNGFAAGDFDAEPLGGVAADRVPDEQASDYGDDAGAFDAADLAAYGETVHGDPTADEEAQPDYEAALPGGPVDDAIMDDGTDWLDYLAQDEDAAGPSEPAVHFAEASGDAIATDSATASDAFVPQKPLFAGPQPAALGEPVGAQEPADTGGEAPAFSEADWLSAIGIDESDLAIDEDDHPVEPQAVAAPAPREGAVLSFPGVPARPAAAEPELADDGAFGTGAFDETSIAETGNAPELVSDLDIPELPGDTSGDQDELDTVFESDLDREFADLVEAETADNYVPGAVAWQVGAAMPAGSGTGDQDYAELESDLDTTDVTEAAVYQRPHPVPVDADAPAGPAGADEAEGQERDRRIYYAAGLLGLVLVFGGGALAWNWVSGEGGSGGPVIIRADKEPVKVVPKDPGGMTVPNQDKAVYDRVAGSNPAGASQPRLVDSAEEPVDVVQRTIDPEILPLEGREQQETVGTEKNEARLTPGEDGEPSTAANDADEPLVSPRRVRTMIVRPDGTIVPREEEVAEAPTADEGQAAAGPASGSALNAAMDPSTVAGGATPGAENQASLSADRLENSAAAGTDGTSEGGEPLAPAQSVETVAIPNAPVPAARPADQPVNVVGGVTENGRVTSGGEAGAEGDLTRQVASAPAAEQGQAAANPGGYYVQIASQPSQAGAEASYNNLSRRYESIIGGRGVDYQEADIPGRGTYYRVRIPGGERAEAIDLCERLQAAGGSCLVTR